MHDSSQNDEIAQEVSCDSLDENMSINNSSLSTTFTTAGREKELLAPILVQIILLLHFHNKDLIQFQTFSSQSKIRISAFILIKCILGFVPFKWNLLNHNVEQTACGNG